MKTRCCSNPQSTCFKKDDGWAACNETCEETIWDMTQLSTGAHGNVTWSKGPFYAVQSVSHSSKQTAHPAQSILGTCFSKVLDNVQGPFSII